MNPTSGVISEAFELYKKHFLHLFVIAAVVYVVIALLTLIFISLGGILGAILAAILSIIGLFLVQAALVEAVADIRDGRADMSVGDTLSSGVKHIAPVAGASILAGFAIVIGLLLLIVPGLFLITIWAVIVPVIVLERSGAMSSFARSRQLVSGYGMNVFGVIVIQFLILIAVGIVLGLILGALPDAIEGFLSSVISGGITGPFSALVVTLLYFRLKAAQEGGGTTPSSPEAPPPPAAP
ncbi:MAG TPA: hypothetical protein VJ927_05485 [Actinomycetota bacterium]|nr:hypothetical protein [Actinomycetota bacterium]